MPNTLIPIQTYTLTSTAASVTFSNIPQNYTDLKVVISARDSSSAGGNWNGYSMSIYPNGFSTNITQRSVFSNGSSATSYTDTQMYTVTDMSADTANTFSNVEIYIPNYTSANAKAFNIDSVAETNATASAIRFAAGLWNSTATITSLQINAYSTFTAGSTFTLYGVSNGVKATGGTITCAGGYAYHTFTSTGTFAPSQKITNAEILAIAGGGGGGSNGGGGGGAGGVKYAWSQTLNAGTTYQALVGAGGAAGVNGVDSVFNAVVATGGGKGGPLNQAGTAGGSGGGGGMSAGATVTGGSATQSSVGGNIYANAGGTGSSTYSSTTGGGGGGGGAGAAGTNATNASPMLGAGGIGTAAFTTWGAITGTGQLVGSTYYYAGGGSGGPSGHTVTGYGGSGGGANYNASATSNTGGGGGAGQAYGTDSPGAGGSGLIIVRYQLA